MPTHQQGSYSHMPKPVSQPFTFTCTWKYKLCQACFCLTLDLPFTSPNSIVGLQGNHEPCSCTDKSLLTATSQFPVPACSDLYAQRADLVTKCVTASLSWHLTAHFLVAHKCFCKAVARIEPKTFRSSQGDLEYRNFFEFGFSLPFYLLKSKL